MAPLLRIGGRQTKLVQAALEAAALDELHGEIGQAVDLADFVNGHDGRVIEVGRRFRLDLKAAQHPPRVHLVGQDHLEGDLAIEADLPARKTMPMPP